MNNRRGKLTVSTEEQDRSLSRIQEIRERTVNENVEKMALLHQEMLHALSEQEVHGLENRVLEQSGKSHIFISFLWRAENAVKNCRTKMELNNWMRDLNLEERRFKKSLPIYAKKDEIVETISSNNVCVIVADTGSGKSTQIPHYLAQRPEFTEGHKLIACTQPRKVAAMSLAQHVSEEMGSTVGRTVGYHVGSTRKMEGETKIVYLTDSAMLRECVQDPLLKRYSCVIVDEAHERSLNTDLLLGLLKTCLQQRDLKVLITSATINPEIFVRYFSTFRCPVLTVPGSAFPVEERWIPPDTDLRTSYLERTVNQVARICEESDVGHVLAFLTSPLETELASRKFLEGHSVQKDDLLILQLHGQLQPEDQKLVFVEQPKKEENCLCYEQR